jgi:hypothetical protein
MRGGRLHLSLLGVARTLLLLCFIFFAAHVVRLGPHERGATTTAATGGALDPQMEHALERASAQGPEYHLKHLSGCRQRCVARRLLQNSTRTRTRTRHTRHSTRLKVRVHSESKRVRRQMSE